MAQNTKRRIAIRIYTIRRVAPVYINPNASVANSLLDHILSPRPSLISIITVLYGQFPFENIPRCCELKLTDLVNLSDVAPNFNAYIENVL